MSTKEVVQLYFQKIGENSDWQMLIDDEMKFESPAPATFGKAAYIVAAARFFQMAETLTVRHLVVEGGSACAWVEYSLFKNGERFRCLVAELLEVRNNRIISSTIMFDTLALKSFTSPN